MINSFLILKYPESSVSSAKPFKSKNRDNVALDGSNKNLKKGYDTDSHATTNQSSRELSRSFRLTNPHN